MNTLRVNLSASFPYFGRIIFVLSLCATVCASAAYNFTVLAGVGPGSVNGTGSAARFHLPRGAAVDSAGNVFVADAYNHTIRLITPGGVVSTLAGSAGAAGSANGSGANARFSSPADVVADNAGNLYVTDVDNVAIRKVVTSTGAVTTLNLTGATIASVLGIAADSANLYVADSQSGTICRIELGTGIVTQLFTANGAFSPVGVAVDATNVYFSDSVLNSVYQVPLAGGTPTLLAGSGDSTPGATNDTGNLARFYHPAGLARDAAGNIYVADSANNLVRMVTPAGVVTTLAGTVGVAGSNDATGTTASFNAPMAVAANAAGDVYVVDTINNTIRLINHSDQAVTTFAGAASLGSADGTGAAARFREPRGAAVDPSGDLYFADTNNNTIRKVTAAGEVTNIAGTAGVSGSSDSVDANNTAATFNGPEGVAIDSHGNVFVTDKNNHTIRKIATNGVVTTFAGLAGEADAVDGVGSNARFALPTGLAVDASDNLYVADTFNNLIRMVAPDGTVSTLAGTGGEFNAPWGVAVDVAGNVYVADQNNHAIRKVTPGGVVSTLAGTVGASGSADGNGATARFKKPAAIAVGPFGNIFVADTFNHTIRKITPAGDVTTVAGSAGNFDNVDGVGTNARFYYPAGIALDSQGVLYVSDSGNNVVRKGSFVVATVTLSNLTATYDGNAKAATVTTDPVGLAVTITYNGSTTMPASAGTYTVEATVDANQGYTGFATGSLVVAKATPTITWTGSGGMVYPTALSSSQLNATANVPGAFVYDPAAGTVLNVGNHHLSLTFTPTDTANYNNATGDLPTSVSQGSQSISFTGPSSQTFGVAPLTLGAVASSGLPVSYTVVSGPATVSGSTLTITGAGTVVVRASQAGSSNYAGAPDVDQSFTVGKASATVTLGSLNPTYDGSPKAATATTNPSSLTVDLTYNGSATAPTNAGNYTVVGTINDANYQGSNSGTLVIAKATPVITWTGSGGMVYPTALTGSQLNATANVPGAFVYDPAAGTVLNVGNHHLSVTFTPTDTTNYNNATGDLSTSVSQGSQSISFTGPSSQTFGVAPLTLSATATSGLPVSFSVVSGPATASGSTLTITGAGTVVVRASQAGNSNYAGAADVDQSFTVGKATPVVTWGAPAGITADTPLSATQLNATSSVAGAFVYNPAAGTLLNAGTHTLTATLTPTNSADYLVISVQRTITVYPAGVPVIIQQPASQAVTLGAPATFSVVAASGSALTYQWRKDGASITGATGSSYSIASSAAASAGNYTVVITNAVGSVTSEPAALTLNYAPIFTLHPPTHYVTVGANVTLTVATDASPVATYQWKKDGVDIPGATSATFTINNAQLADSASYTAVATNAAGTTTSNAGVLTVAVASLTPVAGDFNNDGHPDILWRNNRTGAIALWFMDGTTQLSGLLIGSATMDWSIDGTGDFNGDGQTDLLWRKASSGAVAVWLMNGTAVQSVVTLGNITADWSIAGAGDFNGDGKVDILWRKESTGVVALWLMDGLTIQSTPTIATITADWKMAGTGDFNQDGKMDILWRKESTGVVALWLMDGLTIQSTPTIATITADWKIAGTGDYNQDGMVDILWRKESTGLVAFWLMNGIAIQSTPIFGTITSDWVICN